MNSGNVGIGTTAPKAKFDIGGNITTPVIGTPVAMISDNYNGISGIEMSNRNTGTSTDFRFTLSDTTGHYFSFAQPGINYIGTLFGLNRKTTDYIFNIGGTLRDIAIGTVSNSNLIFGTNGIENMRIKAGGNVGIGTAEPSEKLQVSGNILLNDNDKVLLGTGKDASIYYNGTDLIINPKAVGSGILDIQGTLQTDGYNSSDGSAGITTTFIDADGNTIGVKNGLIVSKTAP